MIRDYLDASMATAQYELLHDDGSWYGEIPLLDGVYANALTRNECQRELESVLEEWILFRVSEHLPIPTVGDFAILPFKTMAQDN